MNQTNFKNQHFPENENKNLHDIILMVAIDSAKLLRHTQNQKKCDQLAVEERSNIGQH